jgi:hypothetical protein
MKRLVKERKNIALVSVKAKEKYDPKHIDEIIKFVTNYDKSLQDSYELQRETSLQASTKDISLQPMVESEIDSLVNDVFVKKRNHIVDSLLLATMYSFLLLVHCVWLLVATVNKNVCESKRMIFMSILLWNFSPLLENLFL